MKIPKGKAGDFTHEEDTFYSGISLVYPLEGEVFEQLISEITTGCNGIVITQDKTRELKNILRLAHEMRFSVLNNAPTNAAFCAFRLGKEIQKFDPNLAEKVESLFKTELDKNDPMGTEISIILKEIESTRGKITLEKVWQGLIGRCGKGCCIRFSSGAGNQQIIVWLNAKGIEEGLTKKQLQKRLGRRKTPIRPR